jgi:hypothetical protein
MVVSPLAKVSGGKNFHLSTAGEDFSECLMAILSALGNQAVVPEGMIDLLQPAVQPTGAVCRPIPCEPWPVEQTTAGDQPLTAGSDEQNEPRPGNAPTLVKPVLPVAVMGEEKILPDWKARGESRQVAVMGEEKIPFQPPPGKAAKTETASHPDLPREQETAGAPELVETARHGSDCNWQRPVLPPAVQAWEAAERVAERESAAETGGSSVPGAGVAGTERGNVLPQAVMITPAGASRAVATAIETARLAQKTGVGELQLQLEPPHLGKVQLRAAVNGGQLTLRLVVETEGAWHSLQALWPQMQQAADAQGLRLDQVQIIVVGPEQARAEGGERHKRRHKQRQEAAVYRLDYLA